PSAGVDVYKRDSLLKLSSPHFTIFMLWILKGGENMSNEQGNLKGAGISMIIIIAIMVVFPLVVNLITTSY
ncbi:MAG TPA: hypothetical protein DEG78_01390, partial [Rhodobacteraceae bacterium]|nr:hypothetical protein [Paracoccaceae bacterium]